MPHFRIAAASAAIQSNKKKDGKGGANTEEKKGFGVDPATTVTAEDLPLSRRVVFLFVENPVFKQTITLVVLFNLGMVIYETDLGVECSKDIVPSYCESALSLAANINRILLVIYGFEAIGRIYVYRHAFFMSTMDIFDFLIVLAGVAGELAGSALRGAAVLRLVRLSRLARTLRIASVSREAAAMLAGLGCAMKSVAIGAMLIAFIILLWSIVAVMFIGPINRELTSEGFYDDSDCWRCPTAFSSVGQASLTLMTTVVFGDEWAQFSMPIIERAKWSVLIFAGSSFSVNMGLVNLILAVILDKAMEHTKGAEARREALKAAHEKYLKLCHQLDTSQEGLLSFEELADGLERNMEWRSVMETLNMKTRDLEVEFSIIDTERTGMVSYDDLAKHLSHLTVHDVVESVAMIRAELSRLCDHVLGQSKKPSLEDTVSAMSADLRSLNQTFLAFVNSSGDGNGRNGAGADRADWNVSHEPKAANVTAIISPAPSLHVGTDPSNVPLDDMADLGQIHAALDKWPQQEAYTPMIFARLEHLVHAMGCELQATRRTQSSPGATTEFSHGDGLLAEPEFAGEVLQCRPPYLPHVAHYRKEVPEPLDEGLAVHPAASNAETQGTNSRSNARTASAEPWHVGSTLQPIRPPEKM